MATATLGNKVARRLFAYFLVFLKSKAAGRARIARKPPARQIKPTSRRQGMQSHVSRLQGKSKRQAAGRACNRT